MASSSFTAGARKVYLELPELREWHAGFLSKGMPHLRSPCEVGLLLKAMTIAD